MLLSFANPHARQFFPHKVQLYDMEKTTCTNFVPLTQDAGEVAEGVEASVGYGIHHSETLVSANHQPEAEECYSFTFNHLSQPIGTK